MVSRQRDLEESLNKEGGRNASTLGYGTWHLFRHSRAARGIYSDAAPAEMQVPDRPLSVSALSFEPLHFLILFVATQPDHLSLPPSLGTERCPPSDAELGHRSVPLLGTARCPCPTCK